MGGLVRSMDWSFAIYGPTTTRVERLQLLILKWQEANDAEHLALLGQEVQAALNRFDMMINL
ncbi:hypothetical protein KIN20_033778 [Parelaphostrongylus tenuis]|uniref:Uncharacterized protein n=1 Tax=Parelaphostrongylus tenuis TaxID=148309 RepID=A0AAD5R8J7_PARTN|nr:hypothetical protein KIN20_033778 [Parelaphostrongylus tenuis]